MKLKIKKGATVQVITGVDKGKQGSVLDVDCKKLKICVQGISLQTHFDKKEGIRKKEGYIDYSNVKLVQQSPKKSSAKKAKQKTQPSVAKS